MSIPNQITSTIINFKIVNEAMLQNNININNRGKNLWLYCVIAMVGKSCLGFQP